MRSAEEAEPMPLSPVEAAAQLPQGTSIVRLESREMMAVAKLNPRSHDAVLADVKAQLTAYPSFAREAIYNKPVGKLKCSLCGYKSQNPSCPECHGKAGQMKYAQGLSIRAAEALMGAWGNCAAGVEVLADTDEYVDLTAIFVDYERCTKVAMPLRVAKFYKTKGGGMVRHPDDRFADVILAAHRSKALREVITRSVPPGLRQELFEAAEHSLATLLTPEMQARIVAQFGKLGATPAQIETLLGKPLAGLTQEDRVNLLGLYNAIKDGETTIQEAFGEPARNGKTAPIGAQAPAASTATASPGASAAPPKRSCPACGSTALAAMTDGKTLICTGCGTKLKQDPETLRVVDDAPAPAAPELAAESGPEQADGGGGLW